MTIADCTEKHLPLLPGMQSRVPAILAVLCLLTTGAALAQQPVETQNRAAVTQSRETDSSAADAATTNPTPQARLLLQPSVSREERDMRLLAEEQEEATVVWLQAREIPFLSLYESERNGNPVGAILILNAEGQHSDWPRTSERIRRSLPEYGWNTLSTQLPAPQAAAIPAREQPVFKSADRADPQQPNPDGDTDAIAESAAEGNSQSDVAVAADAETDNPQQAQEQESGPPDLQTVIDAGELSLARLQKSIEYLQRQGQFNIVLMGNGIGAARAACLAQQLPGNSSGGSRLVRAMVFINARNRVAENEKRLTQCLSSPEIPVLDVYSGSRQLDRDDAEKRLITSRRQRYQIYQQIRLPELAHNTAQGENRLSRRIRGFLEQHARGVKVDNAIIER